jgi:hypothetical protein
MPRSSSENRANFTDSSRGALFLATNDFSTLGANFIAVRNANWQIWVQKIIVNVTTVAAQTLTFADDAATPVVVGVLAASAGLGAQTVLDGGDKGIPLTLGKNLDITASAAGVAGSIEVQCYQKLGVNTVNCNDGATVQ